MSDRYWDGGVSTDPTNVNNWSDTDGGATPASSVPGTGDHARFTANGNPNACTLTANWVLLHLTTLAGYTAKLDLATFDLTMDSGGNVTLGQGGEFDAGTGTITINGDFDFSSIGTLTKGTATFVLTGSGPNALSGTGLSDSIYGLTFDTASSYQVVASITLSSTLLVKSNATVDIATGQFLLSSGNSETYIQSGATISRTGTGYFYVYNADIIQQDGEISAECRIWSNSSLIGGNYSGLLKFLEDGISNYIMTLTGAFIVGSLEFETTSTGNIIVDCTSLTGMTVADNLTVDIDSSGDITINNTGNLAAWVLQGDVTDEVTGGGTFAWTKGDGSITASGTAAQNWNWRGLTIEDIAVNKSAGALTFSAGWTADSFNAIDGELDFNGQTVETVGDFTINGAIIVAGATAMNGVAITVGGDFSVQGAQSALLNLLATASWTLDISGDALALYVNVQNSDATAGSLIQAIDGTSTDSGSNAGWLFSVAVVASVGQAMSGRWLYINPVMRDSRHIVIGN